MVGQIALFTPSLLRLRAEIQSLCGLEPRFRFLSTSGCEAVGGWGHKSTALRAQRRASSAGLPYFAFEDGFLRSLKPGPQQLPMSMVMDRSGIYYDARQPSDLEILLNNARFSATEIASANEVLSALAEHRLSKYNHGGEDLTTLRLPQGRPVVLVVDQTAGDASIVGALSDASTFESMALAAVRENPDALIIAKLHPETASGNKAGHLREISRRLGLTMLTKHVSPWALFDLKPRVYTVSSQMGFEAVLGGCAVSCFGMPFYAGWGLTDDRMAPPRAREQRSLGELAAAVYLRYSRYFDAWRRTPVDALTAIDQLAFLRRNYLSNSRATVGYRIARWKRRAVSAMLDGPEGPPVFKWTLGAATATARSNGAAVAAWGIRAVRLRRQLEGENLLCLTVEDGFIRSAGLGAAFVQPMSLVFDTRGIYYDPSGPSDIEHMLSSCEISVRDLERAREIRKLIVTERITKYNVKASASKLPSVPEDRPVVLVPGQVSDDWAVMIGRPADVPKTGNVNAVVLERARLANPSAFIIFKPHPDVEQLARAGALDKDAARHADLIARGYSLDDLLPVVARVETYSSLSGFEALLRGIPVTVHGLPFYAGWGLTDDRASCNRRGRFRSLEELASISLLSYPRYWDPVSGLPCPPEVAVERLLETRLRGAQSWLKFRTFAGKCVVLVRRINAHLLRGTNDAGHQ